MDSVERKKFWDTLINLDGCRSDQKMEQVKSVIKYPNKLYRFRAVTSNVLECLMLNKLYFSSADKYDDPFDTLIYVNQEKLNNDFDKIFSSNICGDIGYNELKKIFGTYTEEVYNIIKNQGEMNGRE